MTEQEFRAVVSDIDQAAAQQGIDLADPENTVTVWLRLEYRKGSIEYRWHGNAAGLEHAKMLAGPPDSHNRIRAGSDYRLERSDVG